MTHPPAAGALGDPLDLEPIKKALKFTARGFQYRRTVRGEKNYRTAKDDLALLIAEVEALRGAAGDARPQPAPMEPFDAWAESIASERENYGFDHYVGLIADALVRAYRNGKAAAGDARRPQRDELAEAIHVVVRHLGHTPEEHGGLRCVAVIQTQLCELKAQRAAGAPADPQEKHEQSMTTDGELHCRKCGVDIRWIDGGWLDRETHSTCEILDGEGLPIVEAPKHEPLTGAPADGAGPTLADAYLQIEQAIRKWTANGFKVDFILKDDAVAIVHAAIREAQQIAADGAGPQEKEK